MRDLPTGTVTFLFTDIEGSTRLLHELGDRYADVLAEHRRVLREAFTRQGGVEVDTQGDAFFVAFPTASGAIAAALAARRGLAIPVRMGIHTGTPHLAGEGYVGADVNKGARIAAAGHGGQVLLSAEARALAEVDALDLGEHRVKDFEQPLSIFQLGGERFPPLKTISNTNLPRPASSFVGREKDLEEVASLLQDGARLVTLTGPGGSGKTRLALEAAAQLVPEFKAGVFWVGLAALRDPELVGEEIAQTLGAKEGLAEHIGERELLLLLDNLEQVVEAAPGLAGLVEACPNLRLLVTSREVLRVRGEVDYPVLPLAEPEAVELFCARARVERDEHVVELCRALDNLPLALELAAARARVLSPQQIRERLSQRLDLLKGGRDADPRQQTLRATIAWSYELVSPGEQELFRRLGVFRGGCTLETAEGVAAADLDVLQSLVDKSLVRRTGDRFWMLETIREFALDRLDVACELEELGTRHAEHFLALAEEAEPHVHREVLRRPGEWLDRLEREHDNLRAAIDRLEASGETELVLRLVGALSEFWAQNGHLTEGRRRLEKALRAPGRPTAARAKALSGAASVVSISGDIPAGKRWAEDALALHRTLGDRQRTGGDLHSVGYAFAEQGEMLRARELFGEAVRLLRDAGDEDYALWATRSLAWTYHDVGELERARQLHEENLDRARGLGNQMLEATTLAVLAMIATDEGRLRDAVPLLEQAYRLHRELGERLEAAIDLCKFARVLALEGNAEAAARVLACSDAVREEMGANVQWVARMNEEALALVRDRLDEGAFADEWEQGRALTPDAAVALALESLAGPTPPS